MILGGTGQLGQALVRHAAESGREAVAPGRAEVDLAAPGTIEGSLAGLRPSAVINAAAYNDVTAAEREENRREAFLVNRDGPAELARICRRLGVPLVHVSTDYVFDGAKGSPYFEHDKPGPLQWYGRSKLEGERAVTGACGHALVVRTSTLFGPSSRGSGNYVSTVLSHARKAGRVSVVRTPVSSPTYAPDLASALFDLMDAGVSGVVHGVNTGSCSRLELAEEAIRLAKVEANVEERPFCDTPPIRPRYSVLDTALLASVLGRPMRPWREALGEYVG